MASEAEKAWKRRNLAKGESALESLVAWDYRVVQFSEYHFRVNERLDVWPSSKKWFDTKTGRKGDYEELVSFVKGYLK